MDIEAARLVGSLTPVVAAIQGAAIGAGFGLACLADFRVGCPETRLAANFARLGYHHILGLSVTLPALVGQQQCLELLYTGRRVKGEEALALGLIDRVTTLESLRAEAHAMAAEIAASAPLAVREIRQTMRSGLREHFAAATEREAAVQASLATTWDLTEGVRAARERRAPHFEAREPPSSQSMSGEREWNVRLPSAELARHYREMGWWNDETLADIACGGMVRSAAVSCRVRSRVRPFRGTIGDVADQARRLAGTLRRCGIVPGDVVAFQLPNWAEAIACFYAMFALGVVVVPVVHIYGPKEVAHILRQSKARAFVTADSFGRQDYLANLEDAVAGLDDLETIVVVSTDGRPMPTIGPRVLSWSQVVAGDPDPLDRPAAVDPDAPALIGYTSGTTAAPKGVIHTHRTYLADQRTWATFLREERVATAQRAPDGVAHRIARQSRDGAGVGSPAAVAGESLDLMDVWDPGEVLHAVRRRRLDGRGPTVLPPQLARSPRLRRVHASAVHQQPDHGRRPGPDGGGRARDRSGHLARPRLRVHRAPLDDGVAALGSG